MKSLLLSLIGLMLATLALTGNDMDLSSLGACDVSSRAEAIAWDRSHPGIPYVSACKAASGS